jgi:hypothetical protein
MPERVTITAANKTKTYGQTVTFNTTSPSADFTVAGLISPDTVTSIYAEQHRNGGDCDSGGLAVSDCGERGGRHRLDQLHHQLHERQLDR